MMSAASSADDLGETVGATSMPTAADATPLDVTTWRPPTVPLSNGHDFGPRYHIIHSLGTGGMGAVYQAWDKVLEVAVAIKVIRPDASASPEQARALEKRFKREILLARQVTHRNVVRIHDLGEVDGITYITMPYVQGADLATVLKRSGRLPVERVVHIARQVASGLAAAHEAGVVHRDLKPANIMLDVDDDALIMDFGIARSTEGTAIGMTMAGAVVGTMAYMAPEQAQGAPVDQRADIYSFGLILHDMLVGRPHTGANTAVSELMRRMQTAPPAVRTVDPTIPAWLDDLITRCLQPDPAARVQSMAEVVSILEQTDPRTQVAATAATPSVSVPRPDWWRDRRLHIAAVLTLLAVAGVAGVSRLWTPDPTPVATPNGPAVSLAVLPFRNASTDPTLDKLGPSLSQVLATMLGQSSQVRTVAPDRLNQVLTDLRISANAALTPTELARIADFTSTEHVIWGQVTRFADTLRIDATLLDLGNNQSTPLSAAAANEAALLPAIEALAGEIQTHLARGSGDVLADLKATAWKPSTTSFEALRLYNDGLLLTQQGTHQAALKSFQTAVQEDANFALAMSALALSYATLGYDDDAARYSRQAMALSDALPPQEKHRIAANHYRIVNDTARALESYEAIVKASPGDVMTRFTLAGLYEQRGALDQAREHFAAIVDNDPKFVEALLGLGRVEIRRGNPQQALPYLDRARTLSIELGNREARANVLQAIGIAHMRQNRPAEALRHYEESLEIKREIGDKRGMAASLVQIGEVKRALGEPQVAERSYREALALRREIGDRAGVSLTLMELAALLNDQFGKGEEALPLLQEALTVLRETGNVSMQARALNNIGTVHAARGNFSEAQTYFEQALVLREKAKSPQETADTLHNLASTFSSMGRYEQALQRFVGALELRRVAGDRRSAAIEQYGIGTVLDYQGRFGAAASSKKEAVETVRELGLRDAWTSEALSGYGRSLALSGQFAQAEDPIKEGLAIAEALENQPLQSQVLRVEAERLFHSGNLQAAQEQAAQATRLAQSTAARGVLLSARALEAFIAATAAPTRALATDLDVLAKEAGTEGLRALAVECAVVRARVLLQLGDLNSAVSEADRALSAAEGMGLRVPLATAHYVRASVRKARGEAAAARREYAAALRLFEQIRSDDGNAQVLQRSDLAPLYAEIVREAR
jgi:serine/threonine protein kinase/tetratricopeptide (TPR) repeat protein